ncbi:MAG TPA: alpha/beta hydrolase [Polyangiaceae bacterium]|jgi:pimeloyl-ACP methyl ester carboxylesterase|nr:alpha/beta hydrolase [Polyangiaceae bacterium]
MTRTGLRRLAAVPAFIVVFLLALAGVGAFYRPNTDIPAGTSGRQVVVDGVPLRVVQNGTGRDVLLIHGSPGSVEDWEPVAAALSSSFRVTRFDRPGHGYSGDDGEYSFEHNAKIALDLIEALGLARVIVVGHSYGGTTALAMAVHNPPVVSAYVVVDSATYQPGRKPDGALRLLGWPLIGHGFATVLGPLLSPRRIRQGIAEQFEGAPPEGFVDLRTRLWSTPKVMHAIALETIGAPAALNALSPTYGNIQSPVFVVAEADSAFRRSTAERLQRDVRGSSLRLIAGTGHYIQFEKTDDVVNTVRAAAAR